MDRGLISEKPRGLSAKSSRSGPWVDFTRVQGPLCKISEITRITNYFPTVNPVHRGPTVARTEGTAVCSLELSLRPLRCAKGHRRGCKRGRGAWGARLGPHRSSGGAVATERRWCRTGRQRRSVIELLRRGEREKGVGRGAVKLSEGARQL
jgi:hypothetical protein